MKILLDTHIAIWAVLDSEELSNTARAMMLDENNEICPPGSGLMAFLCKRDDFPFKSGNDYGSWKSMDARDLADGRFRFFIFSSNAGNGFEDKESLSRQAK